MERNDVIEFVKSVLPSMKYGETKTFQHRGHDIKIYLFVHATEITVDNEEPFEFNHYGVL